jgi:hypothetical protein
LRVDFSHAIQKFLREATIRLERWRLAAGKVGDQVVEVREELAGRQVDVSQGAHGGA